MGICSNSKTVNTVNSFSATNSLKTVNTVKAFKTPFLKARRVSKGASAKTLRAVPCSLTTSKNLKAVKTFNNFEFFIIFITGD